MDHLAPELASWLERFNRTNENLLRTGFTPTPISAREGLAALTSRLVTDRPQVSWVQEDTVHAGPYHVPVRIYHPDAGENLPVLVYFHGGGHMAGSVSVYDAICRKLALAAHHIVVIPEYRLAPECPYPAALTDGCTVMKNVFTTLDNRRLNYARVVSMAGDSGGGALCASIAHLFQYEAGLRIRRQVLIYPGLDYTLQSPSVEENGSGYLLEKERILWYFDNYFQQGEDRRAASPLYQDFTNRLPETLVLTAGFCPLRDEGIAYFQRIKAVGVYTEHHHYGSMIHAFLNMENLVKETCRTAYQRIGAFLNR